MAAGNYRQKRWLKPGQKVVLKALPEGFIDDLPQEDQQAISKAVGQPILLNRYEEDGRSELEFMDAHGVIHFIYVDPRFLRPSKWPSP